MILIKYYSTNNDKIASKIINYEGQNKTLTEMFNEIAIKHGMKISLFINDDIMIPAINIYKKKLINFLQEVGKSYELHYSINDNHITIEQCEPSWKMYKTQNFHEEELPGGGTNGAKTRLFWSEIENTLNKLTNSNVVIDKNNCIISVYGKCGVHNLVLKYIEQINKIQQVIAEIQFVEVIHNAVDNIDVCGLLESFLDKFRKSLLLQHSQIGPFAVGGLHDFVAHMNSKYNDISIHLSSKMKILLLSQQTGQISSTNNITLVQNKRIAYFKNEKPKDTDVTMSFIEGLSLTIVPLILEDGTILLKLKQSLKTFNSSSNNQMSVQNREIMSCMQVKCNDPVVIGGMEEVKKSKVSTFFSNIPFFKYFIKPINTLKKSQIVIIITIKPSNSNL